MTGVEATGGVPLPGLSGSNPLAFLTALGTLRALDTVRTGGRVQLAWHADVKWTPVIYGVGLVDDEDVLDAVEEFMGARLGHQALDIGDDIKLSVGAYRVDVLESALARAEAETRAEIDFLAAFAADVGAPDESAPDTALRTMAGAGHQHFLATMRGLVEKTKRNHVDRTLFSTWRYDDPVEKSTLRWDPVDDVRYALRWRKPSGDPARKSGGTMWGANRLAFEALPLMPTVPRQNGVDTVGFRGRGRKDTYWTWPIWEEPVGIDSVRSLLSLRELQTDAPDRERLAVRGIAEVYRSRRLMVGKYRAFSPAWPP